MKNELRIKNRDTEKKRSFFSVLSLLQTTDYRLQTNSGFVILFTVLISSIVLAISLGISSVSYKELILSSTTRDGQYAFNTANTGIECALFNDIKNRIFDTNPQGKPISCDQSAGGTTLIEDRGSGVFNFKLDMVINKSGALSCMDVEIIKTISGTVESTTITSRGYNMSCDTRSSPTTNPLKVVERVIQVSY